jgi:hypothetical protein
MPTVGSRRFPYTPQGMKAAAAYAKKTGQRMTTTPPVAPPAYGARRTVNASRFSPTPRMPGAGNAGKSMKGK